ncbi:MAG: iron-sulfur cluster assembly protein [Thiohalocapsa sp.]
MSEMQPEQVKELLRQIRFPGRSRDLVSLGFVKSVGVEGSTVEVELTPDSVNVEKVTAMENEVRALLRDALFEKIEIHTEPPYDDDAMLLGGASINPLQADLLEYGLEPIPNPGHGGAPHLKDLLAAGEEEKQVKPKSATAPPVDPPDAFAPPEVDGPQGNVDANYNGPIPVFQWQIDPEDTAAETEKVKLSIGSWNYVVSWVVHSGADLVYVAVQARHWIYYNGEARPNPAGRTEGVNMVYDRNREGVVAVYGTVKDFRPFVEAFYRAYTGPVDDSETAMADGEASA